MSRKKSSERTLHQIFYKKDQKKFPFMNWQVNKRFYQLNIFFICKYRKTAEKFFYEMLTQWLIPGKVVKVCLNFFEKLEKKNKFYTVCEIHLQIDTAQDFMLAKKNLPFLKKEIFLGTNSEYQAREILRWKGLNLEEKSFFIQQQISRFIRRFPAIFDYDIFHEMHHFLISQKEIFKKNHTTTELCRAICILYRFRKIIEEKMGDSSQKRQICVKCKKLIFQNPLELSHGLGIFVGMNFLQENELFEKRHLLSALSRLIPEISWVPDSYYIGKSRDENIQTIYLEIKSEYLHFLNQKKLKKLEKNLMIELPGKIEHLVPPVFKPRNEEEIIRNLLALSKELKYFNDIPQVMISFEEQTANELIFMIFFVRLLHPNALPILDLFAKSSLKEVFFLDRIKIIGHLRQKIPKEASVFSIRLKSELFLREDYSVDLFQARLHLVKEIERVMGKIRDYNGGLIAKQIDNFHKLEKLVGNSGKKYPLLLQNFFHAINPSQWTVTLDPEILKPLFLLLVKAIEKNQEDLQILSQEENTGLSAVILIKDLEKEKRLLIQMKEIPSNELLEIQLQVFEKNFLGYIYLNREISKRKKFLTHLERFYTTVP